MEKIVPLIHFSIRSGAALIGQNRLESAKSGDIGLILLSPDTSSNTVENIRSKFQDTAEVVSMDGEVSLGGMIGKEGVKVMGFKRSKLQAEILRIIKSCEGI
ncbi:MAG TPA: hypothetical protein PLK90_04645 [Clostridiales bacterium]|jgi:hypothetical protein|nr:hypothetical protein [Clostridiales bacterium]HQP69670.1 hypothetical protein [Clostridiales bacterium]